MNKDDIKQFIKAFQDFMKHSEVEEYSHKTRSEAKYYANQFLEQKAAELEVTVDYYIAEFI
jgi:hypothetical protein